MGTDGIALGVGGRIAVMEQRGAADLLPRALTNNVKDNQ